MTYKSFLETENNQWIVKGFIDINKNVYTITNDTKLYLKLLRSFSFPNWINLLRITT